MRISKKTREAAVLTCAVMASEGRSTVYFDDVADDGSPEAELARAAFMAVPAGAHFGLTDYVRLQFAEAAALLRDGWSPGDPVYLLRSR